MKSNLHNWKTRVGLSHFISLGLDFLSSKNKELNQVISKIFLNFCDDLFCYVTTVLFAGILFNVYVLMILSWRNNPMVHDKSRKVYLSRQVLKWSAKMWRSPGRSSKALLSREIRNRSPILSCGVAGIVRGGLYDVVQFMKGLQ